jgi:small subunit ribosomal protein S6
MSIRRLYESTYIINAALEDAEADAVVKRVTDYIEEHGGTMVEVNKWGRRRLAYPIKKKYNGFYVYTAFEAPANVIPLLERFMILEDNVLRHLTMQLDPKLREFRKVRAEAQAIRAAQLAAEANKPSPAPAAAASN